MPKVKIFAVGNSLRDKLELEKRINEWMESIPEIWVPKITQSESSHQLTVCLWYEGQE